MLFVKMNGLGNDYVFFDVRRAPESDKRYLEKNMARLAPKIADRHFGIGSDGAVVLYPSGNADIAMRMFNADGSEGMTCGNALRCIGKYLGAENTSKRVFTVETRAGVASVTLTADLGVTAAIGTARIVRRTASGTLVDIGNPHIVIYGADTNDDAFSIAERASLEYDANAELVSVKGRGAFDMRVYERGSGETLACGSGAAAAAYALYSDGLVDLPATASLKGGKLTIDIDKNGVLSITGNAEINFTGDIDIYRYGET